MAADKHLTFAESLRVHREARGMTLQDVADKLKVDFSLVSKWERGQRKPNREEVILLARYYGLERQALIISWLSDRVLYALEDEEFVMEALKAAEAQVKYQTKGRKA